MTQQIVSVREDVQARRAWDLVDAYGPFLTDLCRAGTLLLPEGTAIGVAAGPLLGGEPAGAVPPVRFSSDQATAGLDHAQHGLNEGPCRDATDTRRPVHAADLADPAWRERWPRFTPLALQAGVRAVVAMPLHAGGVRHTGAVTLYRHAPGALPPAGQRAAAAFTAAATELLSLERLNRDWTCAFAHARADHAILDIAAGASVAGPPGLAYGTAAVLPLARRFDHTSLPGLRLRFLTACAQYGLGRERAHRFMLAAHEAMTNVVDHGGGYGQLLLWRRTDGLWCETSDHGPGIGTTLRTTGNLDPRPRADTRQARPHGLQVINQTCASLDIITDPTGTRVLFSCQLRNVTPVQYHRH